MDQTEDGRPGAGGAGTPAQQAGETCSQSTQRPDSLAGWHAQCEWEGAHQYAEGWAAGYAAGWQAVADEVARATGVRPYSAKAVIAWLCRSTDLGVAERELFSQLGRAA